MASAKIKNTTNYARTGVITLGVPFAKSEGLQPTDTLIVAGAYSSNNSNQKIQWYPQGVRWDDGSVKYARVSFKTDLNALQEKTVSILKSNTSTAIPFVRNSQLWSNFLSTTFLFSIQGVNYTFPTASMALIEGGQTNDHYARYRYFTHLPAAADPTIKYIWVELVAEVFSSLNYIQFYFRFGHYRFYPGQTTTGIDPIIILTQPVTLNIIGPRVDIRWEEYKIPSINHISDTNTLYTLLDPFSQGEKQNRFPAGISHAYKGVLVYETSNTASAELTEQILGMAVDWKNTYPITGIMPPRPSYITSDEDALSRSQALLNQHSIKTTNYRAQYNWSSAISDANTPKAGTHGYRDYGFGLRGWPFMSTTDYSWIPFLEFSTRTQAYRHNWYYGTDGNPVPPNDFRNNNVKFWSGAMWNTNPYALAGYTRIVGQGDVPHTNGASNSIIYGPEKEHYTNGLHIIQGFITMDWFSLEYAKMYSKLWCYCNRTDNYPTTGLLSATDKWGVSRAVGRVSQNAAFLYEFTADPELKYWIERRLDWNYQYNFDLKPEALPGGTEIVRAVNVQAPCTQAACLRGEIHWRPWEEGQACFGLYFLAKCVLNTDPTNSQALIMLRMARDSALSTLKGGFKDTRQSVSNYRLFYLGPYADTSATRAVMTNGQIAPGLGLRGLTSNATATIYHLNQDTSNSSYGERFIKLYARNASGNFIVGENIRLDTGFELRIDRITPFAGGAQSHHISPPTNGYAGYLTQVEEDAIETQVGDNNYSPDSYPFGLFKYKYTNTTYTLPQTAAIVIAREAAALGLYPDSNAEIYALANSYYNGIYDEGYNDDNGDFNEEVEKFMGYLVSDAPTPSIRIVYPTSLRTYLSIPEAAGSITNIRIDYTFTCTNNPNKAIGKVSPASVIANTSISASVVAGVNHARGFVPRYTRLGIGYLISAGYNKAVGSVSAVENVIGYSLTNQRRRFCYVFIEGANSNDGDRSIINEQGYEDPIFGNGGSVPFSTFHRVSVLNTISTPVTDYVLQTPINTIEGLQGESVGLNGQTLRSEGYTWYIGSDGTDVWDEEQLTSTSSDFTHTIQQSKKGGHITQWETTNQDTGVTVNWLRRFNAGRGLGMCETFTLKGEDGILRTYRPTFGGAYNSRSEILHDILHLSPLRSITNTYLDEELGGGLLLKAAVTPLDHDVYPSGGRDRVHNGSPGHPAISRDMKQYYVLGVDAGISGVSQLDFWSFHPQSLPYPTDIINDAGDLIDNVGTQEAKNIIALHLVDRFRSLYFYDPSTNFTINLTPLLVNRETSVEGGLTTARYFGKTNEPGAPLFTNTIPSIFNSGYAGVITSSPTDDNFAIGIVTKLFSDAEGMTKPTLIGFRNERILNAEPDIDVDSGQVLYVRSEMGTILSPGSAYRASGWIGMRVYIVMGTLDSVRANMRTLYVNGTLDTLPGEDGLFSYERPAIL
jgi:hypothetical protein